MYSYEVKIKRKRPRTALWGGEGITNPFSSTSLFLLIRVAEMGEEIEIFKQSYPAGPHASLGKLIPGEVYTLPLENVVSVTAASQFDVVVACTILGP